MTGVAYPPPPFSASTRPPVGLRAKLAIRWSSLTRLLENARQPHAPGKCAPYRNVNACTPMEDDGGELPQAIREQAFARWSNRMRRNSSIVYGVDCVEWVERT